MQHVPVIDEEFEEERLKLVLEKLYDRFLPLRVKSNHHQQYLVFISYAWVTESESERYNQFNIIQDLIRIRDLLVADWHGRSRGFIVYLDIRSNRPDGLLDAYMKNILEADAVLCFLTPVYKLKFDGNFTLNKEAKLFDQRRLIRAGKDQDSQIFPWIWQSEGEKVSEHIENACPSTWKSESWTTRSLVDKTKFPRFVDKFKAIVKELLVLRDNNGFVKREEEEFDDIWHMTYEELTEENKGSIRHRISVRREILEKVRLLRSPFANTFSSYVPHDASVAPLPLDNSSHNHLRKPLLEHYVLAFLKSEGAYSIEYFLLLLGDSGAGKSFFVHHLIELCLNDLKSPIPSINRIPLIIDCKDLDFDQEDLEFYFTKKLCTKYGFSALDLAMLKTLALLVIFDGYDEKKVKNINLYNHFALKNWNAKVIVTCRLLYVYEKKQEYEAWFKPSGNRSLLELYVSPFSQSQIHLFIERNKGSDKSFDYLRALEENPSLYELVENPLLLYMVVECMPELLNNIATERRLLNIHERVMQFQEFTQADIYQSFIASWYKREYQRLQNKRLSGTVSFWNYKNFPMMDSFGEFCEELALAMFMENSSQYEVEYKAIYSQGRKNRNRSSEENPWAKFFITDDPVVSDIRMGCPLRFLNNRYSFYHKSFLEYFIALALFNGLLDDDMMNEPDEIALKNLEFEPINIKLISRKPEILEFLAQMIHGDRAKIERLLSIVRASSKNGDRVTVASANAISVLKRCFFNFSGLDLERVNVDGADMRGAYCDQTKLNHANLKNVLLANAWLRGANLTDTNLDLVDFGVFPHFQHESSVRCAAYSIKFGQLLAATDERVFCWDVATGRLDYDKKGAIGRIDRVIFCDDNEVLAAKSEDRLLLIWRVTYDEECIAPKSLSDVDHYCLDGNNKGIVYSDGTLIKSWNYQSDTQLELYQHTHVISCINSSRDFQYCVFGDEVGTVHVYNILTRDHFPLFKLHQSQVECVAVSANGRAIASSVSTKGRSLIRYSNLNDESNVHLDQDATVDCIQLTDDGKKLVFVYHQETMSTVKVWQIKSHDVKVIHFHDIRINSLHIEINQALSSENVISAGSDGKVKISDITNSVLLACSYHSDTVNSICLSDDGNYLVSGSEDSLVRRVDFKKRKVKSLYKHDKSVQAVVMDELNTTVYSAGFDNTLKKCDLRTYETVVLYHGTHIISGLQIHNEKVVWYSHNEIKTFFQGQVIDLGCHGEEVFCIDQSLDGNLLVSGSDNSICLWDLKANKRLDERPGHISGVSSVSLSKDKSKITFGCGNGNVYIMNTKNGAPKHIGRHTRKDFNIVKAVYITEDNSIIMSGGWDKTLRIWDLQTEKQKNVIRFTTGVCCLSVQEKNGLFAVGLGDGNVQLWQKTDSLGHQWQLRWSSTYPNFFINLNDCNINGLRNITPMTHRLFRQHVIEEDEKIENHEDMSYDMF